MRIVAVQILILILLLFPVPVAVGGLCSRGDSGGSSLAFRWVGGQFLLWAGFQLICVPMILRQRRFSHMAALFAGYTVLLLLLRSEDVV